MNAHSQVGGVLTGEDIAGGAMLAPESAPGIALRKLASSLVQHGAAGDFGTSHSRGRALIDAHMIWLWQIAEQVDIALAPPRLPTAREIEPKPRRWLQWLRRRSYV